MRGTLILGTIRKKELILAADARTSIYHMDGTITYTEDNMKLRNVGELNFMCAGLTSINGENVDEVIINNIDPLMTFHENGLKVQEILFEKITNYFNNLHPDDRALLLSNSSNGTSRENFAVLMGAIENKKPKLLSFINSAIVSATTVEYVKQPMVTSSRHGQLFYCGDYYNIDQLFNTQGFTPTEDPIADLCGLISHEAQFTTTVNNNVNYVTMSKDAVTYGKNY